MFAISIYLVATLYNVKFIISPRYGYFGFSNNDSSFFSWVILILINILPVLLFPLRSQRPSLYIFYMFYFFMYVPSTVVLHNVDENLTTKYEASFLSVIMFLCLLLILFSYRLPLVRFRRIKLNSIKGVNWILALGSISCLVILLNWHSNFSFISMAEIYQKRDDASLLSNGFLNYLVPWTSSFMLPIIFSIYYQRSRYAACTLIIAVYVSLYFLLGSKMHLLAFGYFLLAIIYCKFHLRGIYMLALLLSAAIIFPLLLNLMSTHIEVQYIGLVNFRTFAVQALAPSYYLDFFSNHDFTYFSHISGINLLVEYQFDKPLAIVLNDEYELGNYNTSFLFGDGYAGFGVPGMFLISFLVAGFFLIFDSISSRFDRNFVIISLAVFTPSFLNVPLMTSMLTGGGVFFLLYYLTSTSERIAK